MKALSLILITLFAFTSFNSRGDNLDGTGQAAAPTQVSSKPIPYAELDGLILRTLPIKTMDQPPLPGGVNLMFTLPGYRPPIEDYIVKMINAAKSEILFDQYCITSQRIADALVAAHQRKCTVVGIIEPHPKGVDDYNAPDYFLTNGICIFYSTAEGVNNNKYCIIDREIVITGSYDWTNNARTSNSENLITVSDPAITVAYYNAFITQLSTCLVPKRTKDTLEQLTGLPLYPPDKVPELPSAAPPNSLPAPTPK